MTSPESISFNILSMLDDLSLTDLHRVVREASRVDTFEMTSNVNFKLQSNSYKVLTAVDFVKI